MTSLKFDDIYEIFLGYIKDYEIASMDTQDAYDQMYEWMYKSYSKPYIRRLFSSLSVDKESQEISYDMKYSTDDSIDKDFIIDVLAKGMVIEWLQPQVKSKLLTSQMFGGKEQKFFAQSNHLSELRGLLEDTISEQRKLIRDRGYISNEYLEVKS